MRIITDLHLHSHFSRAVSKAMTIPNLALWGEKKGLQILGTGDFTHPLWLKELSRDLTPAEPGLFRYKKSPTRFLLSVETSHIYKRGGKVRKVHNLIFAPSFKAVRALNKRLAKIGNLAVDGRPILGLDSEELLKIVLEVSKDCLLIPAHIWTPWFSVFGSRSGFDSLAECFGELSKYIFAVETGLSSSPAMNWRVTDLDSRAIVSFGDAHSLAKLGREATVLEATLDYYAIIQAIKKKRIIETLEFFPEEGKYHIDGHRDCGFFSWPEASRRLNNQCPKCSRPLVIGVLNRVASLATRAEDYRDFQRPPFRSLIPLAEIISAVLSVGPSAKKVALEYERLLAIFGNELNILLSTPTSDLAKQGSPRLALAIERVRAGKVQISPGFDGQFGKISIFSSEEKQLEKNQAALF